jgi:hypothetical protein
MIIPVPQMRGMEVRRHRRAMRLEEGEGDIRPDRRRRGIDLAELEHGYFVSAVMHGVVEGVGRQFTTAGDLIDTHMVHL